MMKRLAIKPLLGDWLVIILSVIVVVFLFKALWTHEPANKLEIRLGNKIIGVYDLNQTRDLHIQGHLGQTEVRIQNGQVRFKKSPCTNQYCVHQGWLSLAGQVAICLPNQISLELLGAKKPYDSLNY